jgi:hypothetical protein
MCGVIPRLPMSHRRSISRLGELVMRMRLCSDCIEEFHLTNAMCEALAPWTHHRGFWLVPHHPCGGYSEPCSHPFGHSARQPIKTPPCDGVMYVRFCREIDGDNQRPPAFPRRVLYCFQPIGFIDQLWPCSEIRTSKRQLSDEWLIRGRSLIPARPSHV